MRRLHVPAGVFIVFVWLNVPPASRAESPTSEQKKKTVAYIQSLQKPNGGFAVDGRPETPATLPATSTAIRALNYFGGTLQNRKACEAFVLSCYDRSSGGHTPTPGGKPDVRTTVIGLMAMIELGLPTGGVYPRLMGNYLTKEAKSFEDIRISAAAFEAMDGSLPVPTKIWLDELAQFRNADGSYGKGANMARDTGSAVAATLRLGSAVFQKEKAIAAIRAGQLADGGFGKEGQTGSDLETCYRVMRAFHMLKEKPNDTKACREFIAKCRNGDGSYSVQPGQPGNISGTYYAGIILHWLDEMK